jgi:hypothetical protein
VTGARHMTGRTRVVIGIVMLLVLLALGEPPS